MKSLNITKKEGMLSSSLIKEDKATTNFKSPIVVTQIVNGDLYESLTARNYSEEQRKLCRKTNERTSKSCHKSACDLGAANVDAASRASARGTLLSKKNPSRVEAVLPNLDRARTNELRQTSKKTEIEAIVKIVFTLRVDWNIDSAKLSSVDVPLDKDKRELQENVIMM
ncbi:hypothetical protein EVAR_10068_1 [Eumeta japonica]|uniref:Uncharacterized protein n=1 Tax=Eumeta variegata TaxID=151549 RepID=A0A4C1TR97_EUMVA|nr:hypothetical protein EVAR_10068_1 [Eumeta japonica]